MKRHNIAKLLRGKIKPSIGSQTEQIKLFTNRKKKSSQLEWSMSNTVPNWGRRTPKS